MYVHICKYIMYVYKYVNTNIYIYINIYICKYTYIGPLSAYVTQFKRLEGLYLYKNLHDYFNYGDVYYKHILNICIWKHIKIFAYTYIGPLSPYVT
jgi:hypothetical protein